MLSLALIDSAGYVTFYVLWNIQKKETSSSFRTTYDLPWDREFDIQEKK
jgi:hypothetical protein